MLTRRSWQRIIERHGELRWRENDVMAAVELAGREQRLLDPANPKRVHFYLQERDRRHWLRVIVDFGEEPAIVIHAQTFPGPLPDFEIYEP